MPAIMIVGIFVIYVYYVIICEVVMSKSYDKIQKIAEQFGEKVHGTKETLGEIPEGLTLRSGFLKETYKNIKSIVNYLTLNRINEAKILLIEVKNDIILTERCFNKIQLENERLLSEIRGLKLSITRCEALLNKRDIEIERLKQHSDI